LEHIEYSGNDEIAALIDAYNHMVDVIKSSAKVMASKERDKAWSEMARQVAHEIKNPLTPIKLDLQRLIRMKEKGNQEWGTRFDELSRIILENIDILTETANDFSSFAKLYTQEPVEFDLDQTLSDQISLFDNKEKIKISYIGLKETMIHGPKPQLIRVFVNLITNSIQSIENAGIEEGRIMVCLRKGQEDGYLEITVEDNGPGVAEENIEKLFTPNFTTKTGGAGIGLAMCRNILQMCDGCIRYSRSFSLGGACFTIELPQK
ncbi:MAG: GHKL domain-containing protein, partial [Bacteroidales bacterium]|nr:GHKL domain-containing protein [Bacteroidales bacterium]